MSMSKLSAFQNSPFEKDAHEPALLNLNLFDVFPASSITVDQLAPILVYI